MKNFYNESKNDGFGMLVIAGVIMSIIQIISVVSFVILGLLWLITQDVSFGWALFWPVGVFVLNMLAGLVVGGWATYKISKDF